MKLSRRSGWLAVLAIPAVLVGGFFLWRYLTTPYHFLEVDPGILYRSGTLEPEELGEVLRDQGIRTVLNTRSTSENDQDWHAEEARVCRENGVRLIDLPMKAETPPTPEQVEEWLALLEDPANLPILVHCQHGVVRTGMLVAVYELETSKRPNREVWEDLPMFGHRREGGARDRMRDFILGYSPRGIEVRASDVKAAESR